jgi:hypothetical protein
MLVVDLGLSGLAMLDFIVETPIPKANNLKVTIGVAELVS